MELKYSSNEIQLFTKENIMGSSEFFSQGITALGELATGILGDFGAGLTQIVELISTWVATW